MTQLSPPHLESTQKRRDWISRAHLVINLPDLTAYEDTLEVIGEISKWIICCEVLCVEGQSISVEQKDRWPRLRIIPLPRRHFPKHASRWLARRVLSGPLEIIHDMFGHLSSFCERAHDPARSYVMIHTQRTTNWGWFERVRPRHYQIDLRYAGQRVKSLWYDTRILNAVDQITVMGPGHEQDLIKGHHIPPERISFIPSETNCERFAPITDPKSTSPNRELLYVGALVPAKGLDVIFDTFIDLKVEFSDLKLTLIGHEPPFARRWLSHRLAEHPYLKEIQRLDFVPRSQLIELYHRAHLFIFPSLFEGSPRALREAIACGLPAVVSEIPGHRGIDPESRFLRFVPPHDRERWRGAISAALRESPERYQARAQEGVKWLQAHHRPSAVAQRWMELYSEVAQRQGLYR